MKKILLVCSTISCLLLTPPALTAVYLEGYPAHNEITHVDDKGKITRITLNAAPELSESIDTGSTRPSVAPNQQTVAFIRDRNLWVKNLKTADEQQITKYPKPNLLSELSIMDWSPNSQQILYSVQAVEMMDGMPPDTKQPKVDYGFYLYDFATNMHRPTRFSHRFLGWLDKEHFLMLETKGSQHPEKLIRWHWQRGETKELSKSPVHGLGQVVFSLDRVWAAATVGVIGKNSQIVKINLRTGALVNAGPLGGFTEYQWPSLSPNGAQIAYVQRAEGTRFPINNKLLVGGRPIWSQVDTYKWVNDRLVAVLNSCGLSIVKVENAKRIAYYPKPKTKSTEGGVAQDQSGIQCD